MAVFQSACLFVPAGHYLLTELLLDKLIETSKRTGIQGRIINVSSVLHWWVKKDDFCFSQLLNPNKLEKLAPPSSKVFSFGQLQISSFNFRIVSTCYLNFQKAFKGLAPTILCLTNP